MQQDTPRGKKRTRIVRPYPTHTLEEALEVSRAIQESNAGLPFDRELLASALGTTPASSSYTMRLNSSARYGLTQGGYNDERISLTPRGESTVAPKDDDERRRALIEAALHPDVFRRFYEMLEGKRLPEDTYTRKVLQRDLGVHTELTGECLEIIKANGLFTGLLKESDDHLMISLQDARRPAAFRSPASVEIAEKETEPSPVDEPTDQSGSSKVFVSRSADAGVTQFVISVLDQFGIPWCAPAVSEDVGRLIPARISHQMRSSRAAILVLTSDAAHSDANAASERRDRMLYLLGAATALFGERVVVFSEAGLDLGLITEGLHCVEFERGRHAEAGLALLRELHRAGVISIGV